MKRALLLLLLSSSLYGQCSITVIQGSDTISASRLIINSNFSCLATNNIPVSRLNSGINASPSTFWSGDGSWKLVNAGDASKLQGRNVSATAPTNGQVLAWVSANSDWEPLTSSGLVSSVFARSGAVTSQTGDYTAAQVTNAVDSTSSYNNPAWLTSLALSKIPGAAPLASPVFTGQPTLPDFTFALHTHANAANAGQLDNTAVKTANKQGSTGSKFSMATGSFTTGNCRMSDASGNEVDAGFSCVPGSGNATQIQGRTVAATAPTDGQALIWVNANSDWEPGSTAGSPAHYYTNGGATGIGPTTFTPSGTFTIFDAGGSGNTSTTIKAGASQSSPLLNVTDNSSTSFFRVASDGSIIIGNGSLSGATKFVSGALVPVTGSNSDCVHKDGSASPCGGGGGASSMSGWTDAQTVRTSSTILTVAPFYNVLTFAGVTGFASPATITLGATTQTGTITACITKSTNPPKLQVYVSGGVTIGNVTVSGQGAGAALSGSACPRNDFPITSWTASNGVGWDVNGGIDLRSNWIIRDTRAGTNLVERFSGSDLFLDVDTTVQFIPDGTVASSSASCTKDTVVKDTVAGFVYFCVATNTWKRSAMATW